jgi:(1->4)-alpha-D-glucan 1-alpha-D-glucosylmutase
VNEVGGSPAEFGISVEEFHRGNLERAQRWPFSMLATSTHDTKRSEDVRARLNVLSEMPKTWSTQVMRWRRLNRPRKPALPDARVVPDWNEEYLLYQTLVGAWPLAMDGEEARADFLRRIQQYMTKAVHEAKVNLSWVNPDPDYVRALQRFVARLLAPGPIARPNLFLKQVENFVPAVAFFGYINSLAQTLLKITAPGVPDTYQGNELWDFSLVDPDNRRPVDFGLRQELLRQLSTECINEGNIASFCDELVANWRDGRPKLWTTLCALRFRRDHRELFQTDSYYLPLQVTGPQQEHVIAFGREHEGATAVIAVPRLAYTLMKGEPRAPLGEAWGDAEIVVPRSSDEYLNVFTGETLRTGSAHTLLCREVFAHFPVALLAGR